MVGDIIRFVRLNDESDVIVMKVIELNHYSTLLEMYSATFETDIKDSYGDRYKNPQEVVDDTPYYSDDDIKRYGCLAIRLETVKY